MKKNTIIGILISIIIILITLLIVKGVTVKYKYYDDNLISIKNNTNFKVKANIIDNNLVILSLSNNKKSLIEKITLKAYDDNGKQLITKNESKLILDGSIVLFELPNLDDAYAGELEVTIDKEDSSANVKVEKGVKATLNDNVVDVDINVKTDNNLQFLSGDVVAIRNNKVVGLTSFIQNDVIANSEVNINTDFIISSEKYDDIYVFISSAS